MPDISPDILAQVMKDAPPLGSFNTYTEASKNARDAWIAERVWNAALDEVDKVINIEAAKWKLDGEHLNSVSAMNKYYGR